MVGALINARRDPDGSVVVEIRGEIDVSTADRLCQLLVDTATRQRPPRLVVDLMYLTFIDSVGIGALVAGRNAARTVGIGFTLRNPTAFISDRLRHTGLYGALIADH